jgi:hypothetical protein
VCDPRDKLVLSGGRAASARFDERVDGFSSVSGLLVGSDALLRLVAGVQRPADEAWSVAARAEPDGGNAREEEEAADGGGGIGVDVGDGGAGGESAFRLLPSRPGSGAGVSAADVSAPDWTGEEARATDSQMGGFRVLGPA